MSSTGDDDGQVRGAKAKAELVRDAERLRGDVLGLVDVVQNGLAVECGADDNDNDDDAGTVANIFDARHVERWKSLHILFRKRAGELMARVPAVAETLGIEYD